ncbi:hypothetical protein KFE25_013607 [Diacronema lutheri]|uniref:Palmitoyl-protein thioesterase n=2 Tax=Diacronema lutheri TaxID=2081491 RepID=A0A8J5XQM7_DIALT|nr:hypothetical protein KFE25_013607 [Diacronema lutheri]
MVDDWRGTCRARLVARCAVLAMMLSGLMLADGLGASQGLDFAGGAAPAILVGAAGVAGPRGLSLGWPRRAPGAAGARAGGGARGGARARAAADMDEADVAELSADGRLRARKRGLLRAGAAAGTAAGAAAVLQRVAPRPVVLVHGVLQTAEFMREVADWIEREIRGTYVLAVEIGSGAHDSLMRSMNWQVEELARVLQADGRLRRGINLIGYSQGALLCRAYIERHNRPRVYSFISWLGPQGGQFGVPEYEPLLRHINWVTSPMWYTDMLQERLSFANYWRDPFRLPLYRERSSFLADINNERAPRNTTYTANIRSLESMLLVYSTSDTIIIPRESGWFAAFADNSTDTLVPLEDQPLYREDWIGLRSLAESNRLHFGITNCRHYEATTSACKFQLFDKLTLPHLLPPSTHLSSLVHALLPRRPRGNARDGGGGRGGWRGPPAHYDAQAVEREELAMLRMRCVALSNQLGHIRTENAALRDKLKAANARRPPPAAPPPAEPAAAAADAVRADLAARRTARSAERGAQPPADDAEQMRRQLDAADARLAADDDARRAQTARRDGGGNGERVGGVRAGWLRRMLGRARPPPPPPPPSGAG